MTAKRAVSVPFHDALTRVEKAAVRAVRGRDDYRRYVRDYFTWTREKGLAPAETDTLRRYVRGLAGKYNGGSFSPILAAIKNGLRGAARSLLSAVEAAAVAEALRAVKAPRKATNAIQRNFLLSPAEEKAVLAIMTKRDGLLFRFLLKTGARVSEALGIRLADVKASPDGVEMPVMGKGGKMRTLRLCAPLYAEIREGFPGETFLFETREGKSLHRAYVFRRVSDAVKKACGKKFSPHGCRHTFATRAIEKTGKLKAVADYLGHSSTAITLDLYTHEELTAEELNAV